MIRRSRVCAVARAFALGMLTLELSACDSAGKSGANGVPGTTTAVTRAVTCTSPDKTAIGTAVREFIKTSTPAPQRFLMAAGTDTALPEAGFKALQDKGPTFYYSTDTIAQRKMREKLANDGPYASMLVVYHGKSETADGNTVTVSLGGHFIGGVQEGKVEPTRSIVVVCDSTGWKVSSIPTGTAP